jgi:hypothetical protein
LSEARLLPKLAQERRHVAVDEGVIPLGRHHPTYQPDTA